MQTIGYAKVKIDLGCTARGMFTCAGERNWTAPSAGNGKGGSLITCSQAARPAKTSTAQRNIYLPPAAKAFLMLASTSLFETSPAVSATIFPSRPTK